MYLIWDVFRARPGKAKNLVNAFKQAAPFMEAEGFSNIKIMTDTVANYWTVVLQTECESLDVYEKTHVGLVRNHKLQKLWRVIWILWKEVIERFLE